MTFVAGFFSFNLSIVDSAHDRYESVRVKIPRHPTESEIDLIARVLAFAHAYAPGLEFSGGLFDPKSPTIWEKDILGEITRWIQLGAPERDKIHRALRHSKAAEFRVYFITEEDIERFCHYLRGSTTNWVERVQFYLLDPEFLEKASEDIPSSSTWQVTFADDAIYLTVNGQEFESAIHRVDIWDRFQLSIQNA